MDLILGLRVDCNNIIKSNMSHGGLHLGARLPTWVVPHRIVPSTVMAGSRVKAMLGGHTLEVNGIREGYLDKSYESDCVRAKRMMGRSKLDGVFIGRVGHQGGSGWCERAIECFQKEV